VAGPQAADFADGQVQFAAGFDNEIIISAYQWLRRQALLFGNAFRAAVAEKAPGASGA
jgi:hypothetical protein